MHNYTSWGYKTAKGILCIIIWTWKYAAYNHIQDKSLSVKLDN
jgi:hypothetical protein